MSTDLEPGSDLLLLAQEPSSEDKINAELMQHYLALKRDRHQERFYYIVAIVILSDVSLLPQVPFYLGVFVCAVEGFAFLSLAERWGVDGVCLWADRAHDLAHKYYDVLRAKFTRN